MHTITLPARCDRSTTIALFPELNDAADDADVLLIDASKVEQLGQLMLQALAAASRCDGGIEITASSGPFDEAVRLAKLDKMLGISGAAQ